MFFCVCCCANRDSENRIIRGRKANCFFKARIVIHCKFNQADFKRRKIGDSIAKIVRLTRIEFATGITVEDVDCVAHNGKSPHEAGFLKVGAARFPACVWH